jgi:hypothetical protein
LRLSLPLPLGCSVITTSPLSSSTMTLPLILSLWDCFFGDAVIGEEAVFVVTVQYSFLLRDQEVPASCYFSICLVIRLTLSYTRGWYVILAPGYKYLLPIMLYRQFLFFLPSHVLFIFLQIR